MDREQHRRTILPIFLMFVIITSSVAIGFLPSTAAADTLPTWKISTIDATGDVGQYCSLEVDAAGVYYISYYDATNGHLKLATNRSGSPETNTIDGSAGAGLYSSLDLDANGKLHISYEAMQGMYLFYLTDLSGSFVRTAATMNSHTNNFTAVANDGYGKAYIVYFSDVDQSFYYACNSDGTWIPHWVHQFGDVGRYASMIMDHQRRTYSSFYDATNKDLRFNYNFFGNQAPVVDSQGDVGQYTSIGLDGSFDPEPYISYYDATNGDLKLAYHRADVIDWKVGWNVVVIDGAGDVGKFSSIKVAEDGKAFIAYYDATEGNLKYAEYENGDAKISIVDAPGNVGQYASISIDGKGRPSIAYYDVTNGDLKLATLQGAGEEKAPVFVPNPPLAVNATRVGDNSIRVTWSAPIGNSSQPEVIGYRLFAGTGNGIPSRIVTLENVTEFLDSDLEYNTTYEYWVTAYSSVGEGAASDFVNITTGTAPQSLSFAPPAPTIASSANAGYTTASFGWSPPLFNSTTPLPSGYRIYRGLVPESMSLVAALGNVTSYTDTGLLPGTQYYYEVAAVNTVGEGTHSAAVVVVTQMLPAPDTGSPQQDWTLLIVGAVALIAVVIAVVALFRRKA